MSSIVRTRKNLLGDCPPETIRKDLNDLLQDCYYNKINRNPAYQSMIRWYAHMMNELIATVMNNRYLQPLLMYRLKDNEKIDKNKGCSFEMVDGQHRIFSLKAFMDASFQKLPHIKKPFIVYWDYESEDGNHSKVFYKETVDVVDWCNEHKYTAQYLNEKEKEYFDNYGINLGIINATLSIDQRREIFTSLQTGIPVKNSDLLKNKIGSTFIAFLNENNYQDMMSKQFIARCHKNVKNYWLHWASRSFLLFLRANKLFPQVAFNDKFVSEIFAIEDKQIKKLIETNKNLFNPSDETVLHKFDEVFRIFIGFLGNMREGCKLNPTQIFALFYDLCDDSKDRDIMLTHMPVWSKEGCEKGKKTMWESKDKKGPRREYFDECLDQLNSFVERAPPLDDRQVSKKMRKEVFAKAEKNTSGDCLCAICEDVITIKNFEAGHIVSRDHGGPTTIENLLPMCVSCNRGMGTRNAWEYKNDEHPSK